jgi:predicted RNA methylase
MENRFSKSSLAIILSKLSGFSNHDLHKEQYETPSEIAADFLWQINMIDRNIAEKNILDIGCGTGILGIGAMLLGAKHVTFVEIDNSAIEILKNNIKKTEEEIGQKFNYQVIHSDISSVNTIQTEICICNPPFGTKNKHVDREFLNMALKSSNIVYSFHKTSTLEYLQELFSSKGFDFSVMSNYNFELHATQKFHTRKLHRIEVSTIRIRKHDK